MNDLYTEDVLGRFLCIVVLVGCVQTSTVQCVDGTLCPGGSECAVIDDVTACVAHDDVAACVGKDESAECGTGRRCYQGVCLPTGCGNARVELDEVCDDGNNGAGDGCSADCSSDETCGNGVVDLVNGEACDDGPDRHTRSHDGCASDCAAETPRWTQYPDLSDATDGSWAYDEDRMRIVLFASLRNIAETWEFDGRRWMRQLPVISPVPRRNAALAFDVIRRRVILFGGDAFNDTWEWDGATWTLLTPATSPPARHHHQMVTDPVAKRIVLFGGSSPTGMQDSLGDTWAWDGSTWSQLQSVDAPSPRERFSMAFDPARSVIVLFGGLRNTTMNDETWELTGSTWVRKTLATTPGARRNAILGFDPHSSSIVLHGGSSLGVRSDTWFYDGTTWRMHPVVGPTLATGALAATFTHEGDLIAFDSGRTFSFDNGWSTIEDASSQPVIARQGGASAVDIEGRRFAIHGGSDQSGVVQSTLVWTGVWRRMPNFTGVSPGRVSGAAMAYDAKRKQFVWFGGFRSSELLNETWVFDGTTWSQKTPPPPLPAPRSDHVMVYDAARERVMLFGGFSSVYLDDTWEWDGAQWIPAPASTRPSARASAAASYDPVREVVLLFGGDANGFVADTWEWNGVAWTDVSSPGPVARGAAGLAWDAARRRMMLFGGATAGATLNDQWEWDGATWRQVPALGTRSPRQGHALFSALDGYGVMTFGGSDRAGTPNAELAQLLWSGDSSVEICDGRDLDGDAVDRCDDPDCWQVCTPQCPPGATTAALCGAGSPGCGDTSCNPVSETCVTCPVDCGPCL